jgi:hypothetical protein
LCLQTSGFCIYTPTIARTFHRASNDDEEPDLFDYFDPLLSPHAYPNGISPNVNNDNDATSLPPAPDIDEFTLLGLLSSTGGSSSTISSNTAKVPKVAPADDVFDPRISPHAYTNGIPNQVGASTNAMGSTNVDESPLTFNFLTGVTSSSSTETTALDEVVEQQPDYFDPRLSPHVYTNGVPDTFVGDAPAKNKKIGVLLMDHGSRNQASNDRLQELARLYQQSHASHGMVVTAAHMEIAPPSIPDGLQVLLNANVDEIICHPYFLSANGRHVSEDIPEIIDKAKSDLNITIPITTTEPVGSQTDVMISAMHALVAKGVTKSK